MAEFLSTAQLQRLLSHVRYKPHWRLRISEETRVGDGEALTWFTVAYEAADASGVGALATVTRRIPVPDIVDAEHFLVWMRTELRRMEDHEVDEWIAVTDGESRQRPFNPHQTDDERRDRVRFVADGLDSLLT